MAQLMKLRDAVASWPCLEILRGLKERSARAHAGDI